MFLGTKGGRERLPVGDTNAHLPRRRHTAISLYGPLLFLLAVGVTWGCGASGTDSGPATTRPMVQPSGGQPTGVCILAIGVSDANGGLPPGRWKVWVSDHPSGKELVALEGTIGSGPSVTAENATIAPSPLHKCGAALGYNELRVSVTLGDGSWGPFVMCYPEEVIASDSPARTRVFEVVLGVDDDASSTGRPGNDEASDFTRASNGETRPRASGVQFSVRECP